MHLGAGPNRGTCSQFRPPIASTIRCKPHSRSHSQVRKGSRSILPDPRCRRCFARASDSSCRRIQTNALEGLPNPPTQSRRHPTVRDDPKVQGGNDASRNPQCCPNLMLFRFCIGQLLKNRRVQCSWCVAHATLRAIVPLREMTEQIRSREYLTAVRFSPNHWRAPSSGDSAR